MLRTFALGTAAAVLLAAGPAADAARALERAMGPYYSALVASSRGNIDATSRELLLFASRWEGAAREARTSPPRGLEGDPAWPAALDRVSALLTRARELARERDVAGAHAELERIRTVLYEVRDRHHVLTFDDHLTRYHEAVERLAGHVAGPNEIRLDAKDIADVDEDLQGALAAWHAIAATAGDLKRSGEWREATSAADRALKALQAAVAAKDPALVARGADAVRSTYSDLLLAVARARA